MDRRPLERIVRWQPDCTAAGRNDNAGFEDLQRGDNSRGLRTRSEPRATNVQQHATARPAYKANRWTVSARQQRATTSAEKGTTQAETTHNEATAHNPLRKRLEERRYMRSADRTLAQPFNEAKLPAV